MNIARLFFLGRLLYVMSLLIDTVHITLAVLHTDIYCKLYLLHSGSDSIQVVDSIVFWADRCLLAD